MTTVALGDRGQVTIPSRTRRRLGLKAGDPLLLEEREDGSLVLRPAAVYPIEIYTDERIKEFLEAERMTPAERRKVQRVLGRPRRAAG